MRTSRFLITGGAGFIGSHVADVLIARGDRVVAVDNLSTGRLSNIRHLLGHPRFQFVRASITDEIVMDRLASTSDVILHFAAAVGVRLIVQDPVHTIETNIMGTEAILKAALRYRCRVLLASTSEVYGKGVKIPFSEKDDLLLGGTHKSRWAYGASKMIDEFLGLAYQRQYDLDVAVFRLFNTVGPRQRGRYGMVVPRFIRQALAGEPITVYGDGSQTRCFCDVRDAAEALILLTSSPDSTGSVFNIGNDQEVSINQLARRVKVLTESSSPIVHISYSDAYGKGFEDMQRRVPDLSRIQALVGWRSTRTLDQILIAVRDHEQPLLDRRKVEPAAS